MLDSLNRTIGICGFKGAGKDTSADHLVAKHGYRKTSLAAPIKKVVKEIFDFPDEHLYGSSHLREVQDERYRFSGLDPVDGSPLHPVRLSRDQFWQRESDGEFFLEFISPRLALTTMGTEWGRRLTDSIWVSACLNQIRRSASDRWVVPDVRFLNEVEAIQSAGGKVVRLLRGMRTSSHPSELEMETIPHSKFDICIDNQGSKEDLFEQLDRFMRGLE